MVVCTVNGRPTDKESVDEESINERQGWNQQQLVPSSNYPGQASGYPIGQPISNLPSQLNSRPAYAYDNAFPDQVNFAQPAPVGSLHHSLTSAIHSSIPFPSIQNSGFGGYAPTGYQAPSGIAASASVVKV